MARARAAHLPRLPRRRDRPPRRRCRHRHRRRCRSPTAARATRRDARRHDRRRRRPDAGRRGRRRAATCWRPATSTPPGPASPGSSDVTSRDSTAPGSPGRRSRPSPRTPSTPSPRRCGGPPSAAPRRCLPTGPINTLDAMVGHRNERYRRFGWASARADDVANWIPARLTAIAVVAVRPHRATDIARTVRRDAPRHPSPNGGVVEAAFAAALDVRLGGTNTYGGVVEDCGDARRRSGTAPDRRHRRDPTRPRRTRFSWPASSGSARSSFSGEACRSAWVAAPDPADRRGATPRAPRPPHGDRVGRTDRRGVLLGGGIEERPGMPRKPRPGGDACSAVLRLGV